jgi:hypothetical protein
VIVPEVASVVSEGAGAAAAAEAGAGARSGGGLGTAFATPEDTASGTAGLTAAEDALGAPETVGFLPVSTSAGPRGQKRSAIAALAATPKVRPAASLWRRLTRGVSDDSARTTGRSLKWAVRAPRSFQAAPGVTVPRSGCVLISSRALPCLNSSTFADGTSTTRGVGFWVCHDESSWASPAGASFGRANNGDVDEGGRDRDTREGARAESATVGFGAAER